MINSALIEILKSFNKEELKEFDHMVSSDYFNRKSAVTKLWAELSKYAPIFRSPALEREEIYKIIFPGKAFNYGTMKNLVHDLTKLAEKFIELKVYSANANEQTENLLRAFLQRGLNGAFEKNIKVYENRLETNMGEVQYHSNKYSLEVLKQNYLFQQDKYYQTGDSIKSANENMTMGYFVDFFGNNYNSLYMQTEISMDRKNDFIYKVLDFFKSTPVEMDYKVNIYYNAFMLILEGTTNFFYELRRLMEKNFEKLSGEQKYNFYAALANYCSKKCEEGAVEFARTEYEIYRFMIDNSIYSIDSVKNIDGNFYKKVSGTAVNAGEIEWAMFFINKYKDMLEPEVRENYYFHALIEYHIKQKNFEEAQKCLSRIKHTNYLDKLNIKKWEIITGYELGHFEGLRYTIDSIKHFLRSDKKVFPLRKKRLYNFTVMAAKLISLNENRNSNELQGKDITAIKEELKNMECSNKNWLLEKIGELNISV